jgi:glycosyltransferase involved in cell wall biosynthesis
LSLDERIQVHADVPDLYPYLSRAKVALAPLRIGTGSPNKVLEAMAAGTPVVATPAAVQSYAFPSDIVAQAATAEDFAREVVNLLGDTEARERRAARGRALVTRYGAAEQREKLAAVLAAAVAR